MKPTTTFLKLLIGALITIGLESLKDEQTQTAFLEEANTCPDVDQLIVVARTIPGFKETMLQRITGSNLLIRGAVRDSGPVFLINVQSTVREITELRLRINQVGATLCEFTFDSDGRPNAFHAGPQLRRFVDAADKVGYGDDAEMLMGWLSGHGAVPDPAKEPVVKGKGELATATV